MQNANGSRRKISWNPHFEKNNRQRNDGKVNAPETSDGMPEVRQFKVQAARG